jgi:PHS family inorganic phosphate transporter-like MFS transporter
VLRLLRDEYPQYANSTKIHQFEGFVASAALFGSMFGQLVAGNLADIIGRKVIFVATAVLITLGSFLSAATCDSYGFPIYYRLSLCRFILGVGVGGEYPLAATVTSESSSARSRGSLMCAVFAMQGVGSLLSVLIVMLCLSLGLSANATWRISLAFGAVPVVIAFPWRLYMHETETFEQVKQNRLDCQEFDKTYGSTDDLANNTLLSSSGTDLKKHPNAGHTYSRWQEIKQALSLFKWHLLGTAGCWYLLDVDFYANGLFNHDVTAIILSNNQPTTALQDARNSMIICMIGIPGYFISVYLIEYFGRKTIQLQGFLCMAALFAVCGYGYEWFLDPVGGAVRKWTFMVLYALTFLFR